MFSRLLAIGAACAALSACLTPAQWRDDQRRARRVSDYAATAREKSDIEECSRDATPDSVAFLQCRLAMSRARNAAAKKPAAQQPAARPATVAQ